MFRSQDQTKIRFTSFCLYFYKNEEKTRLRSQTPLILKSSVEEVKVGFFFIEKHLFTQNSLDPVFLFIKDDPKAQPLTFGNSLG